MQKEKFIDTSQKNQRFRMLLKKAKEGDNTALEEILKILDSDIKLLARYIKMPKEDGIQEIKLQFIEALQSQNKKRM